MFFLPAQFPQNWRHFNGFFVGVHDLIQGQIPHGWRHPRIAGFGNGAGVDQSRVFGLVVAPLNASALGGGGVAGIPDVGGVALIPEQRVDDLFAGAGQFFTGPEEQQRMFQRHQRQGRLGGVGHQRSPDAHGQHHVVGFDVAFVGFDATDLTIFHINADGRSIGKRLKFAGGYGFFHQVAGYCLRTGYHQTGVRVPHGALNAAFV